MMMVAEEREMKNNDWKSNRLNRIGDELMIPSTTTTATTTTAPATAARANTNNGVASGMNQADG